MSIVLNVITPACSWVAYDGRALRDGGIISENQKKAIMINRNICVGFTGNLGFAQQIIRNLKERVAGIADMRSDSVTIAIRELLSIAETRLPSSTPTNFLITGINNDGKLATYTLGTDSPIQTRIPVEKGLLYTVLHSSENRLDFSPYIQRKAQNDVLTEDSIISGIYDYIADVSRVDPTVNDHVSIIRILQ